ncbi:MAG TPA: DUF2313 domain-containing protein [Bacillus bacterium]|uniref:putative phage tail protein n=1 Tax=Siminovitchia fordii TaxID=254759 RepID=UPI00037E11D4|nr:putative phage tail protein [Siminovitchia fordii]HBZ09108.1 DUF2313 domain-containing protein [Bacillus sp. (in: firmicutes)]
MNLKDKIITSPKAIEMMNYILPFYDNDEYLLHAFQAIGKEFDSLFEMIDSFDTQPYPQRATWSLPYWEQLFGLIAGAGESIEERRRRVIAFLGSGQPVNRKRVENILTSAAGVKVDIFENISPYTLRVILNNYDKADFIHMMKVLEDVKPAHLSYTISSRTVEKMKFKEKVYVNLRRYHTVREFRVGNPAMREQNEVAL